MKRMALAVAFVVLVAGSALAQSDGGGAIGSGTSEDRSGYMGSGGGRVSGSVTTSDSGWLGSGGRQMLGSGNVVDPGPLTAEDDGGLIGSSGGGSSSRQYLGSGGVVDPGAGTAVDGGGSMGSGTRTGVLALPIELGDGTWVLVIVVFDRVEPWAEVY